MEGQQGAVLVEFALVLPLLLLLLLGMVDFGRAFNYWIDENHLANVAARWAAVDGNPERGGGSLSESILAEADTPQLKEGARVCIVNLGEGKVGEPVEATVSYDYRWMPFISNAIGGIASTTITGSATMRIEQANRGGSECTP
jgi:TadE-like protein